MAQYNKSDRPLVISQLENKEARSNRLRRERRGRRKPYYPMPRQYYPMIQQLRSRVQSRYNYLAGVRRNSRDARLDVDRRMRMITRPYYFMRPLVHAYPQQLAVPLVRRIA